jgi:hypothetical protein
MALRISTAAAGGITFGGMSKREIEKKTAEKYGIRIVELERENATLRERIARADGSLFDMKRDTAKDIARLMIEQGGESKFKTICGEGRAYLKAKAKPAPAG